MKNLEINNADKIGRRTVGLEFENPLIKRDGEPINFEIIQQVWKTFVKYGWSPRIDPVLNNVIDGCSKQFGKSSASIMADAGAGNFELAISPEDDLHSAKRNFDLISSEIRKILKERNFVLAGLAIQPGHIENPDMFRRRNAMYLAWSKMVSSNIYAGTTSAAISAHQVGIGMKLEEFVAFTNELIKITGLIVALCGNSPIQNWKILPWKEWRIICMSYIRLIGNTPGFEKVMGFPDRPFEGIADFFRFYWNTPSMILPLIRKGEWIVPEEKINFLDFFKKDKIFGRNVKEEKIAITPEAGDINWASIQMWPHVKPHISLDIEKINPQEFVENFEKNSLEEYLKDKLTNCYIECRAGAASPVGEEVALPALMLGIVSNFSELKKITDQYKWDEWKDLVPRVAIEGISVKMGEKSILPILKQLYDIAFTGLKNRSMGEEKYLEPIERRIITGKNPADLAIEHFKKGKKDFLEYISYK